MTRPVPLYYPWASDGTIESFPPTLLAELSMCAASNAIREKPNWWDKIKNPTIVANWRHELYTESRRRDPPFHLSEEQIDFVFKELDWYAEKRQEQVDRGAAGEATIDVGVEGTRRADGLIPEMLRERLLKGVYKLMDKPDEEKDWHPGSDNLVLDLVHPSLFPFVAGRTRVTEQEAIPPLEFITAGKILDTAPIPPTSTIKEDSNFYSKNHQWLPTDFDVSSEGKVKARSYINNLHPVEHKEMYPILEEILEKFLPMFEEVLSEIQYFWKRPKRLEIDHYDWYGPDPEFAEDHESELDSDEDDSEEEEEEEEEEEDEDDEERQEDGGEKTPKAPKAPKEPKKEYISSYDYYKERLPLPPSVPIFSPPESFPLYNLKTLKTPLQIITKLANIELTPSSPFYRGGTWHVEGMANENIVATGIYYYDTHNITDSRLNFRMQIQEPRYHQSDDRGAKHLYGVKNKDPLVQDLDGIYTRQGRCLVFPNFFQHQVQSFQLADPTKPGSRKILAFFLVHPEEPVLSTTFVPPQQRDWDNRPFVAETKTKLPPELLREIEKMVDWPMDLEEAKRHRADLMKERGNFSETINELFEIPFDLCEH
ncbi:hypothetical protein EC991_001699 [Linnemannia zychae]|nr:hypothetical protein EC991_001699 [Linnemannia zychae]